MKDLIKRLEEAAPLHVVTKGQQAVHKSQNEVQKMAAQLMYLVRALDDIPGQLKKEYKGNKNYARVQKKVDDIVDAAAVEVEAARRKLGDANVTLIKAIKALKDAV